MTATSTPPTHPPGPCVKSICQFLANFAPIELAEEWDNVGLLVGHTGHPVRRIMTCLTITPATVAEAIEHHADMIVSHHPLPFRPLRRITDETIAGAMLLDLIKHQVAVYSPHTAFDSAPAGINQQLANLLALQQITPLRPATASAEGVGGGRCGKRTPPVKIADVVSLLKSALCVATVHFVGDLDADIETIGIACGSAGEFLTTARERGCQLFITGETSFHTCLDAEATGIGLLLLGHFASEKFALVQLADVLSQAFPDLEIWASSRESDPLRML